MRVSLAQKKLTSPFTRSDVTTRAKHYKYVGCVKLGRTETSSGASFEAKFNALSFIYVEHTDQKSWKAISLKKINASTVLLVIGDFHR